MKTLKKSLAVFLALCMLLCVAACGDGDSSSGGTSANTGKVIKAEFSNTVSPEGYPILDDDLHDESKIHEKHMTGLIGTSYAESIGDGFRFGPTTKEFKEDDNYVVWYLETGFIEYCVVSQRYDGAGEDGYPGKNEENLIISISKDGTNWELQTPEISTIEAGDRAWKHLYYKGTNLDPAYKYIKVQFPVVLRYYALCIGRVRLNGISYMDDPDANYENRASATYYVDSVNGNDNNDGKSKDAAFKTLAKVSSKYYQAGDKLLFKKGCKFSGSLTVRGHGEKDAEIYIGTYGEGDAPIISGRGNYAVVLNSYHVTFDGLEITNPQGIVGIKIDPLKSGESPNVTIKNCNIHDVHTKIGETTKLERGEGAIIVSTGTLEPSWFNGLTIENNTIKNVNSVGVAVGNTWHNDKELPTLWGQEKNSPHKNVTVKNNHLDTIGIDGIWVTNSHDVLIEKNTLYRGYQCTTANFDNCAGIWIIHCKDSLIQYNEVGYMDRKLGQIDGQAFDIDIGCINTVLQYNYTHNNSGGFLLVCSSANLNNLENSKVHTTNAVIRYNVSVGDAFFEGTAKKSLVTIVDRVSDVNIYNNTFYMSGKDRELAPIGSYNAYSNTTWSDNINASNNIFHAEDNITVNWDLSKSLAVKINNNIYSGKATVASTVLKDGSSITDAAAKKQNVTFKSSVPNKLDGRDTALKFALKDAVSGADDIKDNGGKDYNGDKLKKAIYGAVQ